MGTYEYKNKDKRRALGKVLTGNGVSSLKIYTTWHQVVSKTPSSNGKSQY